MGVRNAHPHDVIWPVAMLNGEALCRGSGFRTRVVDLHATPLDVAQTVRSVEALEPDLLLVDTTTPTVAVAREMAVRLRRRWPRLRVWGVGQHATEQPEDLLYEGGPFDGCLLGEYETVLPALLDRGGLAPDTGVALPGPADTGVRRLGPAGEVHDPDALPAVDPSSLDLGRYAMRSVHVPSMRRQRWGFLMSSRGCPYRCIFCSPTLRTSRGSTVRGQSPERVVDDIARLQRDHGVTAVYFADDLFTFDRERVLGLCESIRRRGSSVKWAVQTRADCVDRELLRAMRAAGCCAVKIGIESGVDRVLALLQKDLTRERIERAVCDVREAGLSLTACYMLGNPTETLEEMAETFRFARWIRADMIQVSFHTPYPGSESFRRYGSRVIDPGGLLHYDLKPLRLGPVDEARLEREQRRFYRRYYSSPGVLLNYLARRAVYRLADPDEWRLLLHTLSYLVLPSGRRAAVAPASRPTVARAGSAGQVVPLRRGGGRER